VVEVQELLLLEVAMAVTATNLFLQVYLQQAAALAAMFLMPEIQEAQAADQVAKHQANQDPDNQDKVIAAARAAMAQVARAAAAEVLAAKDQTLAAALEDQD
jgi:hypothetical protein